MPARKRKTYEGRVYRGRDEQGKQQFHWVGRFATKHERDAAVAKAKVERPWEATSTGTVEEHAARMIARMESGAMLTQQKRRYKA